MTSPRPPLRLVGAPGRDDDGAVQDAGFAPVERALHDLHAPDRELTVVDTEPPEDAAPARPPLSPRFVVVALIVAQLLAASTFLGKYAGLARSEDQYRFAAVASGLATLCLVAGGVLLALRPGRGRGRALFIVAAAAFGLSLPGWGVGSGWSWPMAFGAMLALAGAWFARAEVRPHEDAAAQP